MKPPVRPVITIVGGGFVGTALALQLRRQPILAGAAIHLIEPREAPGPGLAYSARRPEYLLNVRPGALSLYPTAPSHFADWLARQPENSCGTPEFASRAAYGHYLREELATVLAPAAGPAGVQWHRTTAVAAPLLPNGQRAV
ncbi:MAG: FAD/NAD(P)-binding protein, partial [Bacteroidota bacterium]|nr:FAD/NAD(P)-binding protein [Bacteroidota bacterium]